MIRLRFIQYQARPGDQIPRNADGFAATALLLVLLLLPLIPLSAQIDANERSLYAQGHEALGRGELSSAIDLLSQAAASAPTHTEILFDLATTYEKLEDPTKAIATYRKVLGLSPSHEPARKALERLGSIGWSSEKVLDRADLLVEKNRLTEASYLYKRYLVDHPESERARSGLDRSTKKPPQDRKGEDIRPAVTPAATTREGFSLRPSAEDRDSVKNSERTLPSPAEETIESDSNPPRELVGMVQPDPTSESEAEAPKPTIETAALAPPPANSPTTTAASTKLELARSQPDGSNSHAEELTEPPVASMPSEPTQPRSSTALLALGILLPTLAATLLIWRYRRNCTVRGIVEQFPLPDLLQWLGLSKKVGVLKITSTAVIGRIHIEDGRMIRAEWPGASGEKALNRILSLPRASFVFRERPVPRKLVRNLDLPIQQALMNWAYETDEAGRDKSGGDSRDEHSNPLDSVDDESLNIHLPF